jgi:hypothetical protein
VIGAAISALVEGNSIRSISRMTDVDRNTIASLLLRTGDRCAEIMDGSMRNLRCQYIQADDSKPKRESTPVVVSLTSLAPAQRSRK